MWSRIRKGFSLIELVIVLVIIGVIAAIAIPRMSSAASNAGSTALRSNLQTLRNALELYRAEHGGSYPLWSTSDAFADQLLMYTKIDGTDPAAEPDPENGRIYGPYLQKVPPMPVGPNKGKTDFATSAGTAAWIFNSSTGHLSPGVPAELKDERGELYSSY